jgi:hypothetical protein
MWVKFHNCKLCGFLENVPKLDMEDIAETGLKKYIGLCFPMLFRMADGTGCSTEMVLS